ncbi:MAG: ABC transporter permease [Clostridia bacterium]|nr:ABC transporter permease [Clostridia bacterium]
MTGFWENLAGIFTNANFYFAVIRVTAPILFATLGCAIAEKAGSTNMGMEGIMLVSAFTGVIASAFSGSVWVGLIAALIAGVLMGLVVAYFALKLKVDIILVGIAVNLIGTGLTGFLIYVFTGDRSTTTSLQSGMLPQLNIPGLQDIPVLGSILSGHNILTYLSYIMVAIMAFLMYKTCLGLRIRAVGENPDAAASVGVGVNKTKTIALAISGLMGGFAGAFMSMAYLSYFAKGITAGRGYIALAACAMGSANPLGSMLTSILFGFFYALSTYARTLNIPDQLVTTLPYLATLVGLVIYSIKVRQNELKKLNTKE